LAQCARSAALDPRRGRAALFIDRKTNAGTSIVLQILTPPAVVFFTAIALIADSSAASTTTGWDANTMLETFLKTVGPLGILGWYLYYDTKTSKPRRDRETREERELMAKSHDARIDKLVDSQNKTADVFAESLKAQAEAFASTATRMADVHEKMIQNCFHRNGCHAEV